MECSELVQYEKDMGTFKTVGDEEHAMIIQLYVEGLGLDKIAKQLGRSSRTPFMHVLKHDRAVERSGYCPKCRRVKGAYETDKVKR